MRKVFPNLRMEIPFSDWCGRYRRIVRQFTEKYRESNPVDGATGPLKYKLRKHVLSCQECFELLSFAYRNLTRKHDYHEVLYFMGEQIETDLKEGNYCDDSVTEKMEELAGILCIIKLR